MDPVTYTVELVGGHVDEKGARHTHVVFGHRLSALDLLKADEDPQGQNPTQYNDLIIRSTIIKFGTLTMPVPITVLLKLDSIDREDLVAGHNKFSELTTEGRFTEFLADHKVRLGWGFKINDVVYNHVEFGRRLTGMDEVESDSAGLKQGLRRTCFLIGKQIAKLTSVEKNGDGKDVVIAELPGPIPLEHFASAHLDGADVATLRGAAELWRQSFRFRGTEISGNRAGANSGSAGAEVQLERGPDPGAASRTT